MRVVAEQHCLILTAQTDNRTLIYMYIVIFELSLDCMLPMVKNQYK